MAGTSQPDRRKSEGSQSSTADKKIASVRLIRLVQKHPILYDRKDMYYRNKRKTEEAWNEIATALGENGKICFVFVSFSCSRKVEAPRDS